MDRWCSLVSFMSAAMLVAHASAQPELSLLPMRGRDHPVIAALNDDGSWAGSWTPSHRAVVFSPEHGAIDVHAELQAAVGPVGSSFIDALSRDGRAAIVHDVVFNDSRTFLWTLGVGWTAYPASPGDWELRMPLALGEEGLSVLGVFRVAGENRSAYWSAEEGLRELPFTAPLMRPGLRTRTPTGHVMVGDAAGRAARWSAVTGEIRTLPTPRQALSSTAFAVSDDGNVVMGAFSANGSVRSFYWTPAGATEIQTPAGLHFRPFAFAGSGTIAVGHLALDLDRVDTVVWTMDDGILSIPEFLARSGVETDGLARIDILALSPDGTRMAGIARNPTFPVGWIIENLPRRDRCAADASGDGFVDWFDYATFVDAFIRRSDWTDLNADGFVDFFDYADFIEAFETGC